MKPRIRLVRGMWQCGLLDEHDIYWTVALTPKAAFDLWQRCQP